MEFFSFLLEKNHKIEYFIKTLEQKRKFEFDNIKFPEETKNLFPRNTIDRILL